MGWFTSASVQRAAEEVSAAAKAREADRTSAIICVSPGAAAGTVLKLSGIILLSLSCIQPVVHFRKGFRTHSQHAVAGGLWLPAYFNFATSNQVRRYPVSRCSACVVPHFWTAAYQCHKIFMVSNL